MPRKKMDTLSNRQQEILNFIKETLRTKGYPPSVREIGEALGLTSSSTVHTHLSRMEELGLIRRDPTKPRAIEILDGSTEWRQQDMKQVPLVGRVTAGQPIMAVENIEEVFPLPASLIGSSDDVFMLNVQGTSMINAGIFDGDFVLVREQDYANNGDIVVALVNGEEATVKRFYREKETIRLQPENPSMEPIYSRDVQILGKVIGLFRTL